MNKNEDLWSDIPAFAWISLARRGMEKISLNQCFLPGCDNNDIKLLEPFKKDEFEDEKKEVKTIHIKCKKCGGTFQLKLETIKYVAKPKGKDSDKLKEDEILSMGIIYALDEKGKNLGHLGYF